ncbi:arylsulfatase D-like isoform X2 [Stegostoma tigrinum]|uniref:arylsulfatase D-like isoform X2 n=1 Tax=Stegostoma tigrinum TaxID=3053191 RepID=UPI00202B3A41|nr:arylsulfatase D-like isoform X2 [Stegostoma tigrinum]
MSLYINLRTVVVTILFYSSTLLTYITCTETNLQPNIVLIMADDLGIGDIGCYGNNTMRTPNIDNLAKDGVMLTHHIAAAPLCTPSRAAFMTGRYPIRSGMDNGYSVRVLVFTGSSGGLPENETTFAALLQKQGYATGIIGKWHLGVNCESRNDHCHHPLNHGFDFFYGTPLTNIHDCKPGEGSAILTNFQGRLRLINNTLMVGLLILFVMKWTGFTNLGWGIIVWLTVLCSLFFGAWYCVFGFMRVWNCLIMRNHDVVQQPSNGETLPTRMVEEALAFIERNQRKPFLLLMSFLHVHTPFFTTKAFIGKSKHGAYGDNVEEMDWHVGKKGFAGWEGGIRVPGIFRWPGLLPSNEKIDVPTSLMDIYPTVVSLAGASLPQDRVIDGQDLMPLLKGDVQRSEHEFLFHYCGAALNAVRWHPKGSDTVWKAHFFTPKLEVGPCYRSEICGCHGQYVINHDPPLLFELSKDPSELNPLSPDTEPLFHEIQNQIQIGVEKHRKTLTSVPFQLAWNNVLWKPWLQPCCGTFPFCWCDKDSNVSITMRDPSQ